MIRIQPARAAKSKAYARIRVHSPPAIINLWDRLPTHLQAHIRALAAETRLREVYPTIAHDVVVAAFKRKARQFVRKAMAVHHIRMSLHVCRAQCDTLLPQAGAGVQLPAAVLSALHQMSAAVAAHTAVTHAYLVVLYELKDMLDDIQSHHSLKSTTFSACKVVWDTAFNSARFYAWM